MNTFVCVLKSGGVYTPNHVRVLWAGIKRFNQDSKLICLTDFHEIEEGVEIIPLIHNLPGWFSKLEIFDIPLKKFIYIDLDVIFTGLVKFDFKNGLWILQGFKGVGVNSSVMFINGDYKNILFSFLKDRERLILDYSGPKWGDQDFILDSGFITGYVQDTHKEFVGSWKQTLRYKMGLINSCPSILIFHGKPKPEELSIKIIGPNQIWLFSWKFLIYSLWHGFDNGFKKSLRSLVWKKADSSTNRNTF